MKKTIITLISALVSIVGLAQTVNPTVTYVEKKSQKEVTIAAGSEVSEEAPLDITCKANVDCPNNKTYRLEWKIYKNEDEDNPEVTRTDDDIKYKLETDGTFNIKLYISFYDASGNEEPVDTIKSIKITIAGSQLKCPDGFSPNGDDINDWFTITCKSLVKVKGAIFNRWGQRIKVIDLNSFNEPDPSQENRYKIWDGTVNGKYVSDGVYFVNLDCYGADGIHYKIKKAINVLKGYRQNEDTPTEG